MRRLIFCILALSSIQVKADLLASVQKRIFNYTNSCTSLSDSFLRKKATSREYVMSCPNRFVDLETLQYSSGETSALVSAVLMQDAEVVETLLENGSNPEVKLNYINGVEAVDSYTLLWKSVELENIEIALMLIEAGANTELYMSNGHSLLRSIASIRKNRKGRNILLKRLASELHNTEIRIDRTEGNHLSGRNNLELAVKAIIDNAVGYKYEDLDEELYAIKILISAGADVNMAVHGSTSEMYSHTIMNINDTRLLFHLADQYGLLLNLRNKYGVSKLDNAISKEDHEMIKFLQNY